MLWASNHIHLQHEVLSSAFFHNIGEPGLRVSSHMGFMEAPIHMHTLAEEMPCLSATQIKVQPAGSGVNMSD